MWLAPLTPKRHNDVILVWRRPLSIKDFVKGVHIGLTQAKKERRILVAQLQLKCNSKKSVR